MRLSKIKTNTGLRIRAAVQNEFIEAKIATLATKKIDTTHYLNSGDWVESMSAIVEDFDGNFEIIEYSDFSKIHPPEAEEGVTTNKKDEVAWKSS